MKFKNKAAIVTVEAIGKEGVTPKLFIIEGANVVISELTKIKKDNSFNSINIPKKIKKNALLNVNGRSYMQDNLH